MPDRVLAVLLLIAMMSAVAAAIEILLLPVVKKRQSAPPWLVTLLTRTGLTAAIIAIVLFLVTIGQGILRWLQILPPSGGPP